MLFSGISASMKADENLEKAQTMHAEAEAASEQMKTSEVLCAAIADRADMFDHLLLDLNGLFAYCTAMLDGVTRKKMGILKSRTVDARTFTENELKLVAVTRSLAGAVKAVIDTPILTNEGAVSNESEVVYADTVKRLPVFTEAVDEVKAAHYSAKPVVAGPKSRQNGKPGTVLGATRNVLAVLAGLFMAPVMQGMIADTFAVGLLAFAITTLLIMNQDAETGVFRLAKNICCISIAAGFCLLFYGSCETIVDMDHYVIGSIFIGVVSLILFGVCIPDKGVKTGNFKRTMARIFGCVFFFTIALLVYEFLHRFIGIPHTVSAVITVVAYALFAFVCAYSGD